VKEKAIVTPENWLEWVLKISGKSDTPFLPLCTHEHEYLCPGT